MSYSIFRNFKKPNGILGLVFGKLMYIGNKRIYYEIAKYLKLDNELSILEIGFGLGFGIDYFTKDRSIKYYGIDYSKTMVDRVTAKHQSKIKSGQLKLEMADYVSIDDKRKYDRIIFANVTYFWENLAEPFKKMNMSLNKNGKLVFFMENGNRLIESNLSNNEYFYKHDIKDVVRILHESGFSKIKQHDFSPNIKDCFIIEAEK